jgi:hypothetical protein
MVLRKNDRVHVRLPVIYKGIVHLPTGERMAEIVFVLDGDDDITFLCPMEDILYNGDARQRKNMRRSRKSSV